TSNSGGVRGIGGQGTAAGGPSRGSPIQYGGDRNAAVSRAAQRKHGTAEPRRRRIVGSGSTPAHGEGRNQAASAPCDYGPERSSHRAPRGARPGTERGGRSGARAVPAGAT